MTTLDDPRDFPISADAEHAPLLQLAQERLDATASARADELDRRLISALVERLQAGRGDELASLFAAAPSVAVARQLARRLIDAWTEASRAVAVEGVAATVFALPVVLLAGLDTPDAAATLPAVLDDVSPLAGILRQHGALAGNQTMGFANALVGADALDVARLPDLLAWQSLSGEVGPALRDVGPAPIEVAPGQGNVHLRFVVGSALAAPHADLFTESRIGDWGIPLARELSRQLAAPGVSLLALPRPPHTPLAALQQGRIAQREVAAQLFASNAIRRLRASVGEPSAVISAHRSDTAIGGGELRLSLSSPLDPRQAEGFRCPLYPVERVADVATMLIELLRECRVADIRVLAGVHADRDAQTGMTLLFKADTVPGAERIVLH